MVLRVQVVQGVLVVLVGCLFLRILLVLDLLLVPSFLEVPLVLEFQLVPRVLRLPFLPLVQCLLVLQYILEVHGIPLIQAFP